MTLMEDLLIKGYIDENMNERVKNSTADYIVRLLTFCAKSDGNISSKERDYIIDYIETFDGVWWTTGEEMYEYCLKSSQDR